MVSAYMMSQYNTKPISLVINKALQYILQLLSLSGPHLKDKVHYMLDSLWSFL